MFIVSRFLVVANFNSSRLRKLLNKQHQEQQQKQFFTNKLSCFVKISCFYCTRSKQKREEQKTTTTKRISTCPCEFQYNSIYPFWLLHPIVC